MVMLVFVKSASQPWLYKAEMDRRVCLSTASENTYASIVLPLRGVLSVPFATLVIYSPFGNVTFIFVNGFTFASMLLLSLSLTSTCVHPVSATGEIALFACLSVGVKSKSMFLSCVFSLHFTFWFDNLNDWHLTIHFLVLISPLPYNGAAPSGQSDGFRAPLC